MSSHLFVFLASTVAIGALLLGYKLTKKPSTKRTRKQQLKEIKKRAQAIRSMGGTLEQIALLRERSLSHPYLPEKKYILERALVVARDSYFLGNESSERSAFLSVLSLWIPFGSAMVSLISSGFVPPEYQGFALLFLGIFSGGDTLLRGYIAQTQPSLEWLSARRSFGTIIREVSLRLSNAEAYANLTSERERFLLLQSRCEEVIAKTEGDLLKQIQASLTVAADEGQTNSNKDNESDPSQLNEDLCPEAEERI